MGTIYMFIITLQILLRHPITLSVHYKTHLSLKRTDELRLLLIISLNRSINLPRSTSRRRTLKHLPIHRSTDLHPLSPSISFKQSTSINRLQTSCGSTGLQLRTAMALTNFILTVAGVSAVVLLLRSDVKKSAVVFRRNVRQIRQWLEEESSAASKKTDGEKMKELPKGDKD